MGQKLVTETCTCPCAETETAHAPKTITADDTPTHYEDESSANTIPPTAGEATTTATSGSLEDETGIFQSFPAEDAATDFDRSLPVFTGMIVRQKFHNKASYDRRLAWIKLEARTLCLSEYDSTLRKHKEARIADITGLIAGPPEKFKTTAAERDSFTTNPDAWDCFLSVKFQRGGGVDLRFDSRAQRDMWLDTLTRLLQQQPQPPPPQPPAPPSTTDNNIASSSSSIDSRRQ